MQFVSTNNFFQKYIQVILEHFAAHLKELQWPTGWETLIYTFR